MTFRGCSVEIFEKSPIFVKQIFLVQPNFVKPIVIIFFADPLGSKLSLKII